jgi:2,4-dienoyl-CoA reductase-like NADH-dependent reductase (Old Yellow Enzyme family)
VGSYTIGDAGGRTTLAPSAVGHRNTAAVPREITPAEIKDIQERFAVAALRAKNAGYSGVEIHAAHGFFLSQFMTPYYNLRGDTYGGSTENRARMTLETYEAVRNAVGNDFPVLIKINADDGFEGGVPFADVQYLCKKLAEKNIDAIEISGAWSNFPNKASSYFKREAATIAAAGGTKVIMTGGNKDWREMADILNNTNIEYFGMARALIEDKNLIKKFTQQFQQTAVGRDA